jgi:hypothetical protein
MLEKFLSGKREQEKQKNLSTNTIGLKEIIEDKAGS